AARPSAPGKLASLLQLLDRLVFVILLRIADVGGPDAVRKNRDAAPLEHLHRHRGAGTGKAGNDHDRLSVTESPDELAEWCHVDRTSVCRSLDCRSTVCLIVQRREESVRACRLENGSDERIDAWRWLPQRHAKSLPSR